ncbi:MAG: sigma-70 family RNA polymerase sigma factor [Clostridia bacterium]|nr:sigma-70 family RNA polymerase sigma factor [Clostridia bacterium]
MQQISEVVAKAKLGDFESMEHILKCFKPKVTSICREYFLLGADFDDLIQEGMIGLYKAIVGYNVDKNDNFSSFATMCIHHQVQNAVRVANSKKNQPLNDYVSINVEGKFSQNEDSPKLMLQASDKCAEQLSLDKEREDVLYTQVKQALTNEQYGVLLMYLNGYSYNEMATKYNVTTKKVDNIIQAIKRKLRVLLKGE